MKFKLFFTINCLIAAFFLCLPLVASANAEEANSQATSLAAKVNDIIISIDALEKEMASTTQRMQMMGLTVDEAKKAEMRTKVLDQLIGMELLYQESQKDKITADQAAISAQIDKLKKQFPNETEFANKMAEMNLTEEEIRKQMAKGMAIEKFIEQKITSKVKISEEDLKSFYNDNPDGFKKTEQVRARHILIKVKKNDDDETKKEAKTEIDSILAEAKKGGDFAELAKKHSQGPSSTKGGDLGMFSRQQMVKPFSDAAFALKPGEISEVVETQFGYHIIKLEEKNEGSLVPFEEVRTKIQQFLKNKAVTQKVVEMVEILKSKAKIERFAS